MNFEYDEQYVNTKEMSEIWKIDKKKIEKYCRNNLIPRAYKDSKSRRWRIPSNSTKPLDNDELLKLIFLILKIQNYLIIDSNYINKESKTFDDMLPALKYLELSGYIKFKNNVNKFNNIIFTDKSYSAINKGKTILVNTSSIIDIISGVLKIALTLGELYVTLQ